MKKGKHNPTQKETLKKFLAPVLEKIAGTVREKVSSIDWKRSFIRNIPYFIVFYLADKWDGCTGAALEIPLLKGWVYCS